MKGLSPRAYRKEITRGVDELTEKLRLVERGEWCADREPVLKAYAAGLADPDQQRQAEQHLSHCRRCGEFVGKLTGHLHDLGATVAVPTAAHAMDDGRLSVLGRAGDALHRAREATANVLGGRAGDAASDAPAQALGVSGTARGAGAAGGGALAKLAGLGTAGKLATVCLGGGAAATACLAAGVLPANLQGVGRGARPVASEQRVDRGADRARPTSPVATLRSQLEIPPTAEHAASDAAEPPVSPPADPEPTTPAPEPAPAPSPPAPIADSTPPSQQEFGVAAAAPAPTGGNPPSSGGGSDGGSAAQREFGP